jgi:glycerophosphoryl diester phosphodiesterase
MALKNLFVLFLIVPIACKTSQQMNQTVSLPVFDKEGHRGCRGLMPENTIPAMIKALDLGVTTLEMDAVITADQQVILSHEPFFNHEISTTPDGIPVKESEEKSYNIYKMNYAGTQAFDVGKRGNPRFPKQVPMAANKPLLESVIDAAEEHSKKSGRVLPFYNIETKSQPATDNVYHPLPEVFVELLMNLIRNKKIESRVIIQSFDFRTIRIIHEKYPGIKTAALAEGVNAANLEMQLNRLGFVPDIYSPFHGVVTPQLVEQCHAKGIKIIPWTVNDRESINRLKTYGVDGIITDYPDLFTTGVLK